MTGGLRSTKSRGLDGHGYISQLIFLKFLCTKGANYDHGRNFESSLLQEVFKRSGIWKTRNSASSSVRWHRGALHKKYQRAPMALISNNQQNWDTKLPLLLVAYWVTIHKQPAQRLPRWSLTENYGYMAHTWPVHWFSSRKRTAYGSIHSRCVWSHTQLIT